MVVFQLLCSIRTEFVQAFLRGGSFSSCPGLKVSGAAFCFRDVITLWTELNFIRVSQII